ncbi:type ISP restriction/modification enzyme [Halomonas sp. 707B3]|uniref:DEAD/DEAH box helicase n=1 Tax=Halomonas sp. 707B3 TaxID=1681043 RepID=UPI00209FAF9B|nr:type ISP restriction/modification enzyme [Halomonas sp. 707B3]MCP1318111.1 DEAD/DEAH box helicase family protein [Halomonas sp. 707B3]
MSTLYDLLEKYQDHAVSSREKGTYFENLVKAYFENDDVQSRFYDKVWHYADWVDEQGVGSTRQDRGIDLVARLAGTVDQFCAIQCKFYSKNHRLQRIDIDSFFADSNRKPFVRRILIDTTEVPLGKNAQALFEDSDQYLESLRIDLNALANSRIDWDLFVCKGEVVLQNKKTLRPHQREALEAVQSGLKNADRGKLIMACGTGKTFTALKIAEAMAGAGKRVLFMVPSLALMQQTVTEWSNDTTTPIRAFAACSDAQVGKRKIAEDVAELQQHDLAFPATTDSSRLAKVATPEDHDAMTVVFSTYQSIQVISDAQKQHGLPEFDLIICDEAHRTTGVTLAGKDESNFVRIHDNHHVESKKRLYMTATPRIYGEKAQTKAGEAGAELCSMDDTSKFGQILFHRGFSWAVENDLLTDYKVIVLAMDEGLVSRGVQKALSAGDNELQLDDASRIVGCYKALTKASLQNDLSFDAQPMRRALAFCRDIQSSKLIENQFSEVVGEYLDTVDEDDESPRLNCQIRHVDGTYNAKSRSQLLEWIKAETDQDECRILTNARCLSEGVDVPALDAIMFLHPRKSQIDVVQSVGRVMRRAEGKNLGYVILPIGVPSGTTPEQALNDNEKYKVVWQILNALRAHDERFDATINKADLGEDISKTIEIIGVHSEELNALTAEVNDLPSRDGKNNTNSNIGGHGNGDNSDQDDQSDPTLGAGVQQGFSFNEEISAAILAKIVKKCGTRDYWEDWAKDIAKIATRHIERIKATLDTQLRVRATFDSFLKELRDDLNDSISEDDAIEMLAQHLITRPVFEALFEGNKFTQQNPVSCAIQKVLDALDEHNIEKESQSLEKFYDSVKRRAAGIETAHGKQQLVVQLYDKFFKSAFPRIQKSLGIVYTPVEVVDFIIHSVNDVLQDQFGQTLGSKGVHIIDPFTGTGTFITRLLQSGLIKPEELAYKYQNEIHANEIVLLAYYIAAINIEAVYHDMSGAEYTPFEGICLTDTFQMYEKDDLVSGLLADNSGRRTRQKELDIRVIMGNPPYSSGQKNEHDNAKNVKYPHLDNRIRHTYAEYSQAGLYQNLYDSYIRAFRWASDRLGDAGVMAFVSGSAWIERSFADGMRKCLADEFSSLYVFHLRGDVRKNMLSGGVSGEGQNIFGAGSMTGISVAVLVKNTHAQETGQIYFYDIGKDLTTAQKLKRIHSLRSVAGITAEDGWEEIVPDENNDWIDQVEGSYDQYFLMGDKKSNEPTIFANYSLGVVTNRDAWCIQSSQEKLQANITQLIFNYNNELSRKVQEGYSGPVESYVNSEPSRFSWTRSLKLDFSRDKTLNYNDGEVVPLCYRPYTMQWQYFGRRLNEMVYQMPRIFPNAEAYNLVIQVSGVGARAGFSALMTDRMPSLDTIEKGQCFPLYLYEKPEDQDLFAAAGGNSTCPHRRDAITDEGLVYFQAAYPVETISKEDLFYYVYGLLHSSDYRERFHHNLAKQMPRIPAVKQADDFWAFVEAGRKLGELHVNFEEVEPYPVVLNLPKGYTYDDLTPEHFRVEKKWKFGGTTKDKDKSTVKYNQYITMTGIPLEAYEYVVNGKPALEWVMERQVVKTDKKSGIVNDANDYAIETMNDPAYPLKLFQRVVTVSLETMRIVRGLPTLDID